MFLCIGSQHLGMGIARGLRESTGGRRAESAYFVFFEWRETVRRGHPRGSAYSTIGSRGTEGDGTIHRHPTCFFGRSGFGLAGSTCWSWGRGRIGEGLYLTYLFP